MKDKIAKLIDVKSIVTLCLTCAFIYLSVTGEITEPLNTIYTTVIAFYFGTQMQKKVDAK